MGRWVGESLISLAVWMVQPLYGVHAAFRHIKFSFDYVRVSSSIKDSVK